MGKKIATVVLLAVSGLSFLRLAFPPVAEYAVEGFLHDAGHAYTWNVPGLGRLADRLYILNSDSEADASASRLSIFENGARIGTPHVLHADIRTSGNGRFSHWNQTLYFSSSDGTNPRENGRRYSVMIPLELRWTWSAFLVIPLLLAALLRYRDVARRTHDIATARAARRSVGAPPNVKIWHVALFALLLSAAVVCIPYALKSEKILIVENPAPEMGQAYQYFMPKLDFMASLFFSVYGDSADMKFRPKSRLALYEDSIALEGNSLHSDIRNTGGGGGGEVLALGKVSAVFQFGWKRSQNKREDLHGESSS